MKYGWNYFSIPPFPNFKGTTVVVWGCITVEVWECIHYLILYFEMNVITYPYRDWINPCYCKQNPSPTPDCNIALPLSRLIAMHEAYVVCLKLYDDVIMGTIASQITSLTSVYSTVYSGADQSKHQSTASLAFVWGIHRGPVNSPHKWPVMRKMFPFDDVIMMRRRRHG